MVSGALLRINLRLLPLLRLSRALTYESSLYCLNSEEAIQREEATEVLFLSNTTHTYVGKMNHDLAENH
jgi:hypothetical protein